ncbi:MAG: hypothetical protein Q7T50_08655, partial [Candidatus Magasanikbacteria bacterium]|nr:hypothetical protein [Candidatus Magasanikbacteria bacterium]
EKVGNDFDPVFFFWFHIEVKDEYRRFGREKLYEKYFTKEDEDVTQWLVDTFFEIKNKAQQLPVSISNVLPIDFESIERFL